MIVTRYSVNGPSMKLAVVADLHGTPTEALYDALRRERPDAILIPGDLVSRRRQDCAAVIAGSVLRQVIPPWEAALRFLRIASSIAPTFYSRGNHEWGIDDEYRAQVRATGAVLLENEWIRFGELSIGGLSRVPRDGETLPYEPDGLPELSWLSERPEGYSLLLCHHPEYYPALKDLGVDLIVSGHAHGGQWRFFGRGVFAPGQGLFPTYTRGRYGSMIVSAGLTNTTRIPRFFNPTELVIIELRAES